MMPADDRESAPAYQLWDAAYVLGSLSVADRREFESHFVECEWCRAAVTELSGMPALLAQLDHDVLASFDDVDGTDQTHPPPELLPSLLATVRRRRRRACLAWVVGAAAAAVLAIGVLLGVARHTVPPALPQAGAPTLPMSQVNPALLASTVSLTDESWGTLITLRCVCLAPSTAPRDTLAIVVVGRDGHRSRLASWVAQPGRTATPAGTTSMPADQIASVQVVSAESGDVLLQRTL